MDNKISLAGDLGSGKSTVSEILVSRLGAEYYSTGAIVRAIANKKGMTVAELNVYMETHPEIDHEIDDGLRQLAYADKPMIIDSRMAWHFTKGTFKVYLSCDIETCSARIMAANRQGEHCTSYAETVKETRARRESEKKRYLEQYGVDIKELTNYSLIVDTSYATPDEVAECIITSYKKWQSDKSFKAVYICPERLNFLDEETAPELLLEYSSLVERGLGIPPVTVYERDGDFFTVAGNSSALAYSFAESTYIPATLIKYCGCEREYVKLKKSL